MFQLLFHGFTRLAGVVITTGVVSMSAYAFPIAAPAVRKVLRF